MSLYQKSYPYILKELLNCVILLTMMEKRIIFLHVIIASILVICSACSLGRGKEYPRIQGDPNVIDHTCTDVSLIPDEYITEAKKLIVQLVGQSHSSQLRYGLEFLYEADSRFDYKLTGEFDSSSSDPGVWVFVKQRNASNTGWDINYIGEEHYWAVETGRNMTESTGQYAVDEGVTLYASLWIWCSQDIIKTNGCANEDGEKITFNDERRDAYLNAINRFNTNYPDTTFVYATSVTDTAGADEQGWRVTQYNEDIRNDVLENGGLLFDQADIENWNIAGTEQRIEHWDGHDLYLRHTDYDEGNGPDTYSGDHSNDALCLKKAKAFWWLLAIIAGWDGIP